MTGIRKEKFYLDKYGKEEGAKRYLEVAQRRRIRELRVETGRTHKLSADLENEIVIGNAVRCEECGKIVGRLQLSHFSGNCGVKSLKEYKEKYPQAPTIAPNISRRIRMTRDNLIALYGEKEGAEKWDSYRKKQADTNSLEYKAKKYGWSKTDFDEYNQSRSVTLGHLIERHGDHEGRSKWDSYCERQSYTNTLEYFIERERDVKTGTELWDEYNYQKGRSGRLDDIASSHGVSREEAMRILTSRNTVFGRVSDGEKVFVAAVEKSLGETIKYTHNTKQYYIWCPAVGHAFFYDICCTKRMKIIEYNGDYWHCNPQKYNESYLVKQSGLTAKEIWETDQIKRKAAMDRGFEFMVVWEGDFIANDDISEIIKWFNS